MVTKNWNAVIQNFLHSQHLYLRICIIRHLKIDHQKWLLIAIHIQKGNSTLLNA